MRILCIIIAVLGVIVAAADAWFRLTHGYRIGFEIAIELLLAAVVAGVSQLWPRTPGDRGVIGPRGS